MLPALPGLTFSRIIAQDRNRQIHVQVSGSGEPTVVLLTGLGTPATWWHGPNDEMDDSLTLVARETWEDAPFIAPTLAQGFRVVTYDRAGMQDSTVPTQPRTIDDFLHELKAVLVAVEVKNPIVLIGHSIGGLIALEYARRFPEMVHALVLLDSSHPDQLARFAVAASADQLRIEAERRREFLDNHPERPDVEALLRQGEDAARSGCLGEMPLLVISRGSERDRTWIPRLIPPFPATASRLEQTS